MTRSFHLIEEPGQLEPLLSALAARDTIALDTEADSLHHYRERICLIQLAADGRHWIVDPLRHLDLAPMLGLLADRTLVMHGADYDLRLLYRQHHFQPRQVFDTMIAAQLLGLEQWGLSSLVQTYCQITISKHGQRADWSLRPIRADLQAYAADDIRYLHCIADALTKELAARGRLDWHHEACERMVAASRQATRRSTQEDPWRVKGATRLEGRPAAVLRELWHWREELAHRMDRPPFKVASAESLLAWALWSAENPGAPTDEGPTLPRPMQGGALHAFELALQRGLDTPDLPRLAAPPRHERGRDYETEAVLLKRLLRARDELAHQLGLNPGVLAPREALKTVAQAHPTTDHALRETEMLMNWQADCLAPAILPLLRDEKATRKPSVKAPSRIA